MINEALLKNEELAVFRLRALYSGFGYTQYKMNKFEEYELYVRNKDFLISDRVITFTDTNGKLLALKPDVTLSIINSFGKSISGIHKMYYNENVYRVSGGTGRFKEIMQTGLECIGNIGIYEICEVLYLAIKSLEVIDDAYSLELAHAGLTLSLLKDAGINDSIVDGILQDISLKSTGKSEKLFCEGLLTEEQFGLISAMTLNYSDEKGFSETFSQYLKSDDSIKCFKEFSDIISWVPSENITVNFSLSGDAGYYSGIIFKGYINGIPVSVLSGGQYDKLIRKLGSAGGAVGFAVYLDSFERFRASSPEFDVDVVIIADKNDSPEEILRLTEELRGKGESVLVQSEVPENIKYRRTVTVKG